MKVYRVINGQIDEQDRNLSGPYFNKNGHIANATKSPKKDVFKK